MKRFSLAMLALAGCFKTASVTERIDQLPAPGEFPHEMLNQVLQAHVSDAGLVDYKSIQEDPGTLETYIAYVGATSPESHPELFPTRDDAQAYYINAYNALAVYGVVQRPGLSSVEDNLTDFFYLQKYTVGGKSINLYNLENKVIRPTFEDPRVHWALNCQSEGCPFFPNTAFSPATLQETLDAQALRFVTNPEKVQVSDDGSKVRISQIFEWYAEDFEAAGGPVAYINAAGGSVPEDAEVEIIPYDWALLAQPGRGP